MSATTRRNLQHFTRLPLSTVEVATNMLPNVFVDTPHKGRVQLNLLEKHVPFLFGSVTQTDRSASELIDELTKLEREAKNYLLDKWLRSAPKKA